MIDETAAEIRAMRTHSSSEVAIKAARALEELLDREFETVEEYVRDLERNSRALRRANPSHASLQTTQRGIVAAVADPPAADVAAAKERTREAIEAVVEEVREAKAAAAANVADRLADEATLLTHDYSTTVLAAVEAAAEEGASLKVYVTEARPRVLGRKAARHLGRIEGVDVTLVVDAAAGVYLAECEEVLVGMDCIVGDRLYNRVGTYPLLATARDRGVTTTVAGSSQKVVDEGFHFENDFRPTSEVIREPPEGFEVANPAYDATPTRLIDRVVTDQGVREP